MIEFIYCNLYNAICLDLCEYTLLIIIMFYNILHKELAYFLDISFRVFYVFTEIVKLPFYNKISTED